MSERFWASGHWQVKDGKAEDFTQQWKEWLSRVRMSRAFTMRDCFVR